jgi:hypothetical protein
MADEEGTRSLVDERPEIVVHIPEAEGYPQAPPIVIQEPPVPWIERRAAPWVVLAASVALIALLLFVPSQTVGVTAAPEGGTGGTTTVQPSWTALAIPVPQSDRTLTVNVDGSVDVLQAAAFGNQIARAETLCVANLIMRLDSSFDDKSPRVLFSRGLLSVRELAARIP